MPDSDQAAEAAPDTPPNATLSDEEQAELEARTAPPPEPDADSSATDRAQVEAQTDWEAQYQEQSHSIARMQVVLAHYAPDGLDLAQESKFVIDGQYRPPAPSAEQRHQAAQTARASEVQHQLTSTEPESRRRVLGI